MENTKIYHVMFDVDGTLVMSRDFDGVCFLESVRQVLGHNLEPDWSRYTDITDTGILNQHIDECDLQNRREEIQADVKKAFIKKTAEHLKTCPVEQIPGAADFIGTLRRFDNVELSIATGGWKETALLKLASASIDIEGIPIASSDDHYSRTEIMKIAERMVLGDSHDIPCTYFGDGVWDKRACEILGFNFVAVGGYTAHHQNIPDFSDTARVMALIGLS